MTRIDNRGQSNYGTQYNAERIEIHHVPPSSPPQYDPRRSSPQKPANSRSFWGVATGVALTISLASCVISNSVSLMKEYLFDIAIGTFSFAALCLVISQSFKGDLRGKKLFGILLLLVISPLGYYISIREWNTYTDISGQMFNQGPMFFSLVTGVALAGLLLVKRRQA